MTPRPSKRSLYQKLPGLGPGFPFRLMNKFVKIVYVVYFKSDSATSSILRPCICRCISRTGLGTTFFLFFQVSPAVTVTHLTFHKTSIKCRALYLQGVANVLTNSPSETDPFSSQLVTYWCLVPFAVYPDGQGTLWHHRLKPWASLQRLLSWRTRSTFETSVKF